MLSSLFKGVHYVEKAAVGWIMVGDGDKALIGGRKWKHDWWGWYLERNLQLPFFGSKE